MTTKNNNTAELLDQFPPENMQLPDASQLNDSLQAQLAFLKRQNRELIQSKKLVQAQLDTQRNASTLAERKYAELEAAVNERKSTDRCYRQLFDLAPIGYVSVDASGLIEFVNLAATCLLKLPSSHLTNTSFCDYLGENDRRRLQSHLKSAATSQLSHNWQVTLEPGNGTSQQVMLVTSAIRRKTSNKQSFQIMIVDITQRIHTERLLRNANEYLIKLAHHDPLTKLPNRVMFSDLLQTKIAEKSETRGKLGVIYFDLDGFKPVNDTLGHQVGDRVLYETATRVRNCLGPNDFVARLGGDEFTIILDNPESAESAIGTAQEIAYIIRQPIQVDNTEVGVTSSMGISLYPDHAQTVEKLIKGADAAMYQAKSAGKDQVRLFSRQSLELTDRMAIIETSMSTPRFTEQLELYYQPIYTVETLSIQSVEALVRWEHPTLGKILPSEFIPLAEKSNHILEIGEWVLENACRQNRAWLDQGLEVAIAINVSARQLFEIDFSELVSRCIKNHGLDETALEMEITESAIMIDHHRCRETLHQLKAMGHTFTIDDFGTGYSALARLAQLPVSRLKIDRMFIKDIDTSNQMKSVVMSIINMAHELKLSVICEGIEEPSQLKSITRMNSDFAQGFMMSEPKTATEISATLRANRLCSKAPSQ